MSILIGNNGQVSYFYSAIKNKKFYSVKFSRDELLDLN